MTETESRSRSKRRSTSTNGNSGKPRSRSRSRSRRRGGSMSRSRSRSGSRSRSRRGSKSKSKSKSRSRSGSSDLVYPNFLKLKSRVSIPILPLSYPHKDLWQLRMEMKRARSRMSEMPPMLTEEQRKEADQLRQEKEQTKELQQMFYGKGSDTPVEWSDKEKKKFCELFQRHPKEFGVIAEALEEKTAKDCVQYYYTSKKKVNYKKTLMKSNGQDWATRWANKQKQHLKSFKEAGLDIGDRTVAESPKKGRLMGTIKGHDQQDGPPCPKCGVICKDRNNFKNHLLSHYYESFYEVTPSKKPFACPSCGKENRDRITLIRHYAFKDNHKMLYELTDITPEIMNNPWGDQERSPVKESSTEAMEVSPIALGASPELHDELWEDESDDGPQEGVECKICSKYIFNKKLLKRHMENMHQDEYHPGNQKKILLKKKNKTDQEFSCDKCGKHFKTEDKLNKHDKVHSGSGSFQCEKCTKCFPTSGRLIIHQVTHLPKKPFGCETCGKDFAQKGNLRTHEKKFHPQDMNGSSTPDLDSNENGHTETVEGIFVECS